MSIQGDVLALPLADGAVDGIVSSLCLQWVDDLPAAFTELHRVLRGGGTAILATIGRESLCELRAAVVAAEVPLQIRTLPSAQTYEKAIAESGLEVLSITRETVTEYYPDVRALLDSMRLIGANTIMRSQLSGLTGARRWKAMLKQYEMQRVEKGLPVSWERFIFVVKSPR